MKQLHFATGVRLTRIVVGFGVLAVIKLTAIAILLFAPIPTQLPLGQLVDSSAVAAQKKEKKAEKPAAEKKDATANATAPAAPEKQEEKKAAAAPEEEPAAPPEKPVSDQMLEVKARQAELDKKEADLRTLERELDQRLQTLKTLEAKMQKMIEEGNTLRDEKMKHLVDVYGNMKPKQAAGVLETLDEDIAVRILAGMSGRKAGEILSSVSPLRAAKLSESLTKLQTK